MTSKEIPLRILFVTPASAPMPFVRREAQALRAAGHAVEIFGFDNASYLPWRVAAQVFRLRAAVRRFRPDVVHAQFGKFNALAAALAAGRVPLVVTFRGTDINRNSRYSTLRSALGVAASQIAALAARAVVCVSHEIQSKIWKRRDCTVIPTGVDVRTFVPGDRATARRRLGFGAHERIVLFNAGRNPAVKDPQLAAAAVAEARRHARDLRFVVLEGDVAPDDIPLYMNAADVLLVTSRTEGSPTVVQEAMACNLPVVSVDVGDVRERLTGVSHCAVVSRDPAALGAALAQVLRARRRSDGRAHAEALSLEAIAARLAQIYRSVARDAAASGARNVPIGALPPD
ncbi:MAG: glycosyltransferase [Betaproteobacteria bacterium]|nr:MAG: glycosyltransferase [Betaproteobacteria bacterium]